MSEIHKAIIRSSSIFSLKQEMKLLQSKLHAQEKVIEAAKEALEMIHTFTYKANKEFSDLVSVLESLNKIQLIENAPDVIALSSLIYKTVEKALSQIAALEKK